jgi:hypothetical protein
MIPNWIANTLNEEFDHYCIPEDIKKLLLKNGIVTGSFIFGGFDKNKSDIDILIDPKLEYNGRGFNQNDLYEYMLYQNDGGYDDSDGPYFSCYVITKQRKVLNLLFFDNRDIFVQWKKATWLMKKITGLSMVREICRSKPRRVALFEAIKVLFGYSLPLKHIEKDDIPF